MSANMETRRRNYLTLDQRKEVVKLINSAIFQGTKINCINIAKEFNVSDRTIRRIRDDVENVQNRLHVAEALPCFSKRKRIPVETLMENKLYEWFLEKRNRGEPITGTILKAKALITNESVGGKCDFKASEGWLNRFKSRYGIQLFSVQGEQLRVETQGRIQEELSLDIAESNEFRERLANLMETKNLKLHQLYNATETNVYWRSLPQNTIEHNENGGFETCKDRVTVMVCANADGSHKIPLYVIGKSKNPRCFQNLNWKKSPIKYTRQENTWMNRDLFKEWYMDVFLAAVHAEQEERNEKYQVILILDSQKCQLSENELEPLDDTCSVKFLPSTVSALIQPMDQGIIEKMKNVYRKSLLRELLLLENEESLVQFLKKRSMKNCCLQLVNAWNEITRDNLRRGWQKLVPESGNLTTVDASTEMVDEYLQILYRIPGFSSVTPEHVNQWLKEDATDPGWKILSDSEIIEGKQDPLFIETNSLSDCKQEEEEIIDKSESEELPPAIEAIEALEAFEKYRNWFESRWECQPNHLLVLQSQYEITKDIVSKLSPLKYEIIKSE